MTGALPLGAGPRELAPGLVHHPGFLDAAGVEALLAQVAAVLAAAPPFQPTMPRTGKPLSVRMSNAGPLGWVADRAGYRYQPHHPGTGAPWPPIPPLAREAWARLAPLAPAPDACLVNLYAPGARMGLHQDRDEEEMGAPVLSLSLGEAAVFRYGGAERGGPTRPVRLLEGDALVMGGPARLAFHGVDRVVPGPAPPRPLPGLPGGGRVNLTLRRARRA